MPKCYSDIEKEDIRKRLKENATECMALYGIKKTTVDELVKRTKIPKGTFYLFYESKELLLFEVLMDFHNDVQKRIEEGIRQMRGDSTVEEWTELLLEFFLVAGNNPLLKIMTSSEVEILYKKLPQEVLLEHFQDDEEDLTKIFEYMPNAKLDESEIPIFSAAFRNLFMNMIFIKEAKDEYFEESLRVCIKGLLLQIMN